MKKMTIFTLSAALLTTAVFAGNNDKNIIKNGNFEIVDAKGKISNWTAADWNKKEDSGIITIKQVDSADGKKAAQIDSTVGKGNLLIFQTMKKPAGIAKKYKITLKFKGAVGGYLYTSFNAQAPKAKKIKPQYEHSKKLQGSNDWQELTASYTIKPEYNIIYIYIRCSKTPVIIDDVKVVEITK